MRKLYTLLILVISIKLTAQIPPGYENYNEIVTAYENYHNQYTDLTNVIDFGYSQQENQVLKAFKVGYNNPGSTNLLFISGIKANDLGNIKMNKMLLENLLSQSSSDVYTNLLENINFYFILCLNPDGLNAVLENSLQEFQNNTRDINQNNAFEPGLDGVDLYYNFSNNWIHGNKYNHNNQGSLNFRGYSELSETETKSLDNFLNDYSIHSTLILQNLSTSSKVIYPYNWYNIRTSPDAEALSVIAQDLAISLSDNQNLWEATGQAERNGNISDWLYTQKSMTNFIISHYQENTIPEINEIENMLPLLIQTFEKYISYFSDDILPTNVSRLEIITKNLATNEPLSIHYKIHEKWSDSFLNQSTKSDGKVIRFLSAGNYNLEFKKNGFKTHRMQNNLFSEYSTNILYANINPLETGRFAGQVFYEGSPISGKIIIKNTKNDTIYFNPDFDIDYYHGAYDIMIIPDVGHYMPELNQIEITEIDYFLNLELTQNITIFEELFEGECCNWIFNGPWLVVSDPSQNNAFLADSWDWTSFYNVNTNIFFKTVFPLSFISFYGRNTYLHFDTFSHTEWDNDFVMAEVSLDNENWDIIWQRAGKYDSWERILIPLNNYLGTEFWLRFRLKDGINGLENHSSLTDPGWRIDNIRVSAGIYNTSDTDLTIARPETSKLELYPNPFNPETTIIFTSPDLNNYQTELNIYNIKGQLVKRTIFNPTNEPSINFRWNAHGQSSGIYLIKISNNKNIIHKKVILLK